MTSAHRRPHYGWVVLALSTLVVFGALGLARFGYTVVLPAMQHGLNLDNTQAGALATANLIGYLALSVLGGALAARYGPRAVIAVGLSLAGAGMLFTGLADGFLAAAIWRALTGVGSGASNVPVMGLLASWFAARRRGLASGIAVAGSSLALIVVGPLVPRTLAAFAGSGWRVSWYLFGITTVALAVVAYAGLRNRPAELGLRPVGADDDDSDLDAPTQAPQWGRVYRSAAVWQLGLVYVAFGFSYIIYLTFFTKRLEAEGGYSPAAAGSLLMVVGWLSLLCGLIWGAVSDRIGRKRALILVYLIHALSFSLFGLWPAPPGFTISAVLFGLTAWSIPAIMAATCGDVLGSRLAPAGLGFITLFFGIGQAIGPSVAGVVADATDTFTPVFLLAGGVALLGAVGALRLRPASTDGAQTAPVGRGKPAAGVPGIGRHQRGRKPLGIRKEKVRFQPDKATWHPSPLLGQIVLVTTLNADGTTNIAPKSWISMMAFDPPVLALGCNLQHWTAQNILRSKEFVVNVPGAELAGVAWDAHLLPHPRPLEAAGLTSIPALQVAAPRIEECKAHLECVLDDHSVYGDEVILLGRIVAVSVDEAALQADDPYAYLRLIVYLEDDTFGMVERARRLPRSAAA